MQQQLTEGVVTATSSATDVEQVAQELARQLIHPHLGFVLFFERSLFSRGPIVKLSPFRHPTFAIACLFNLVIGFGIYSSTYLIPVFLGRVRDFSALQIGTTVVVVGGFQLISTVIAARLSERIDRRITIAIGLCGFAASLALTSEMTADWGFNQLFWPQALRGLSIMLCIVPSVGLALSHFAGPELRYASGLFNLMRNLGGAIGIATVNTWLQDDARIAAARFGEALGQFDNGARALIAQLTASFQGTGGDALQDELLAKSLFAREVGKQALTLAFDDVFRLMAFMFVAALIFVPFCKPPKAPVAPAALVEAH